MEKLLFRELLLISTSVFRYSAVKLASRRTLPRVCPLRIPRGSLSGTGSSRSASLSCGYSEVSLYGLNLEILKLPALRFWDPMRGKGCQITSLTSNLAVSNYPERTVSEAKTKITSLWVQKLEASWLELHPAPLDSHTQQVPATATLQIFFMYYNYI